MIDSGPRDYNALQSPEATMNPSSRIYVAGHSGLVGSAIVRRLHALKFEHLLLRTRHELELRDQAAVRAFFERERPEHVFLAAAKVGGIQANTNHPAEFLGDNLQIQTNVIDAAWRCGVKKLLFLGSSCIYPKHAPQPMREDCLLTGPLEPTNEWYAIAKIAGLKMAAAYRRQYGFNAISAMPTNLYGPGDNFSLETSHVLPALIRKFHEAKVGGRGEVVVWGTGTPRREFLHVDDLADALVVLMRRYSDETPINVGCGNDVSIAELAALVGEVVGFKGKLAFDTSKPDGTPRKLLDVSKLSALGWAPKIGLKEGIAGTYRWYLEHGAELRGK
jgi:GDP-L-fucose synthase